MAEFVRVSHPNVEGEAEVPESALPLYTDRGWKQVGSSSKTTRKSAPKTSTEKES